MKIVLIIIIQLFILSACGNKSKSKENAPSITFLSGELAGSYKATLRPLNTQSSGFIPFGNSEIKITDTTFKAKTYLDDDTKIMHIQDIHQGTRCPTLADDTNQDGFIDILEANVVVGNIIVALDGNLDSHIAGQQDYPRGGSFTYTNEVHIEKILDEFNHTFPQNLFEVEGKVVLILGTNNLERLPETVKSQSDLPRNVTLPIACGILRRK